MARHWGGISDDVGIFVKMSDLARWQDPSDMVTGQVALLRCNPYQAVPVEQVKYFARFNGGKVEAELMLTNLYCKICLKIGGNQCSRVAEMLSEVSTNSMQSIDPKGQGRGEE